MLHIVAAYNSMIHRATAICLWRYDYNHEIKIIEQIAIENGYTE